MQFDPFGKPLKKVEFPAKFITCPTWGGLSHDVLYVTSAVDKSADAAPDDEGGHVFRYSAEGVRGVPKHKYAG
jgi:sugar lactone lactonase YvrE